MSIKIIVNPVDPGRTGTVSDWHKWFAWRPVRTVDNKRVWLKTVYKREFSSHSFAGSRYWTEYKTLFDLLKD